MSAMYTSTTPAIRAGATLGLLAGVKRAGDFWVQPHRCAVLKGAHDDAPVIETDEHGTVTARHGSAAGRRACLIHVTTYTATQALALAAGNRFLGLGLRPGRIALALGISAATHYFADRRRPLQRLADAVGKGEFYRLSAPGMSGAVELDRAWHDLWETVAAVLAAR